MSSAPDAPSTPPAAEPLAISLRQLVVRYGQFMAVNQLSLDVRHGEVFGLLGPNGAGKTTTMRVLIGQRAASGGEVSVAGCRLPQQLAQLKPRLGYVPDQENHVEEFSGRQNLQLFARLYGAPAARVDECLAELELDEAADLPVRTYSKGMRRKLLIARELVHQPQVLLLDEPTANLDVHSTRLVRRLLRRQAAAGVAVLLTTHDMEEVEEICDRVAIICRGTLVDCDTPARFIARFAEQLVEVQYDEGGAARRELLSLDDAEQRRRLAEIVGQCGGLRVHSRDFNFHEAFLKLTGQAFQ